MGYGKADFERGMEMEWKKIANMKHRKIIFHSICALVSDLELHSRGTDPVTFFGAEL